MLQNKIINLFRNYIWMLACYFLFFTALGLLQIVFPGLELQEYQQTELNRLLQESPIQFVVMAVIAAPILEEGMFRSLVKPSNNEFIFFICCWLWLIVLSFIPAEVNWIIRIIFLILLILLSFIFLSEIIPDHWQDRFCKVAENYYLLIWGVTSIVFGMVHIFNYVEGFEINFALVILVLPRIIAGFFFGKIKLENKSLVWPIALHAMNNGAVVLFLIPQLL